MLMGGTFPAHDRIGVELMRVWFLLRSGLGSDDFVGSLQAHASRSACLSIFGKLECMREVR